MTIIRRTLLGLAGALALLACSERREVPTGNADGPSFAATASRGAQHLTANGQGVAVQYYYTDWTTTYEYFTLDANGSDSSVYLWYSINFCQLPNWTCTYGWGSGEVPSRTLSGSDKRVSLDVNPADYPTTFYSYGGDPIGPIHVTLTDNGLKSGRHSGTSESVCSPTACPPDGYRYRSNGVYETSSAFATGTAGSFAMPPRTPGVIRRNHDVYLSFQH